MFSSHPDMAHSPLEDIQGQGYDALVAKAQRGGLHVGTVADPFEVSIHCLLYTSPSPRDVEESRMPSSA